MLFLYVLCGAFAAVLAVIAPIIVTVLVEYPFIIWGKVCDNKKFFVALNALTNVVFNGISVILIFLSMFSSFEALYASAWFILAEAIIIPIVEARLYMKISKASHLRIYLLTYLANIFSCGLGIAVFGLGFISA